MSLHQFFSEICCGWCCTCSAHIFLAHQRALEDSFLTYQMLPLCKGILGTEECASQWVGWGGQSAREFTHTGSTLKQWRIGVGGQITQVYFPLVGNPGLGSVQFFRGCPIGLNFSHQQWCVIINTPFIVCPPFPVSLLFSLTLFPGITFQKTICIHILDLGATGGVS